MTENDCSVCAMLDDRAPLPGGRIHQTGHWLVMHVLGSFGPGALAVVPLRHVVHTADLTGDEAAELGGLLQATTAAVTALTDPVQVYTCQWSHTGGEPAHIHFVAQPIRRSAMDQHPGRLGPMLQSDLIADGYRPTPAEVDEFAEAARKHFDANRHMKM
ncbi:hypothetical protein [Actinoplanes sp. NPDC049265]|uniref:hypothetical protein n=1 Tax=Actinoplanes sp. NPDC049265 TaxID=3363902 RepID=UPI0037205049